MTEPIIVVCGYTGNPGECPECGGINETGMPRCSPACDDSYHERVQEHADALQVRRDADDAFAEAVARLRAEHPELTDEQIDEQLRGMP